MDRNALRYHSCNAPLTRRALFPLPTGQTHPPRVAQPEPDVPAPPLAFGEPARVRHQNTWLALRRPEPRVPSRRLASAQQPGRPCPPPDPQRERAFANLVASRARRARLAFPRRRRALGARERPGRRDRRDDARPDGGEGGAGGARARAPRRRRARTRASRSWRLTWLSTRASWSWSEPSFVKSATRTTRRETLYVRTRWLRPGARRR